MQSSSKPGMATAKQKSDGVPWTMVVVGGRVVVVVVEEVTVEELLVVVMLVLVVVVTVVVVVVGAGHARVQQMRPRVPVTVHPWDSTCSFSAFTVSFSRSSASAAASHVMASSIGNQPASLHVPLGILANAVVLWTRAESALLSPPMCTKPFSVSRASQDPCRWPMTRVPAGFWPSRCALSSFPESTSTGPLFPTTHSWLVPLLLLQCSLSTSAACSSTTITASPSCVRGPSSALPLTSSFPCGPAKPRRQLEPGQRPVPAAASARAAKAARSRPPSARPERRGRACSHRQCPGAGPVCSSAASAASGAPASSTGT
mmetsp:Transcript_20744/g.64818  ORF Transcript_20744/g.64818 Transcript_20744/m.64818 type:complete len:316 (-) Transcript_20744:158-1105(-)